MDNLILTIIAAIILMALVVIGLAIGWILTGKTKLRKRCGYIPKKGNKEDESSSCPYCGSNQTCEKKEEKK